MTGTQIFVAGTGARGLRDRRHQGMRSSGQVLTGQRDQLDLRDQAAVNSGSGRNARVVYLAGPVAGSWRIDAAGEFIYTT